MMNALAGATLERSSPVPLYPQATRLQEEAIEDGRLPRGSKLENEPGDPVLTMTRIAYDTGGRPIEYGWHRYPRRRLPGSR